ncbi:MAG: dCMP deaminase family protein [Patescibacteria group bacterium]|nr:dCMP deaminase family protein [Patescibacteria group bacterium]
MTQPKSIYRPSWDDYFMAIAKLVATRSTCDRLHAGAVLVKDKRIISTGYNGSPPGLPHCDDVGHLLEEGHCVRTVHAEHNAILQAAAQGATSTRGSTIYLNYSPCIHCCKYLLAAGIVRVVVGKIYRNSQAVDYLREASIQVDLYQENPTWKEHLVELFTEEIPTKTAPPIKFTVTR